MAQYENYQPFRVHANEIRWSWFIDIRQAHYIFKVLLTWFFWLSNHCCIKGLKLAIWRHISQFCTRDSGHHIMLVLMWKRARFIVLEHTYMWILLDGFWWLTFWTWKLSKSPAVQVQIDLYIDSSIVLASRSLLQVATRKILVMNLHCTDDWLW